MIYGTDSQNAVPPLAEDSTKQSKWNLQIVTDPQDEPGIVTSQFSMVAAYRPVQTA